VDRRQVPQRKRHRDRRRHRNREIVVEDVARDDGMKPVVAGYVLDDNLTIPVASAVAMSLALRYLPTVHF